METKTYKCHEFVVFMLNTLDSYGTKATYEQIGHIIKMLYTCDYDGEMNGHDTANYLYGVYINVAKEELSQKLDAGEWK